MSCLIGVSATAAGLSNRVKTGNVAPMMCSLATRIVSTVEQCDSPHIEEDEEILPGEHESCPCETEKDKALRGDL